MSSAGSAGSGSAAKGGGARESRTDGTSSCMTGSVDEGGPAGREPAGGSVRNDLEEPSQEVRELFGVAFSAAEHFAHMLQEEGEVRGVLGPHELPRLWSRHLVNSAAVVPFLPGRGSVADVGSGAGFPGVVAALLRPDLDVTLIEAMERRSQWLRDVVRELDLDNVTVCRDRAENVRTRFDVVTARAVAGLSKLVRLTAPLLLPGGRLLALKGDKAESETDAAKHLIRRYNLSVLAVHEVLAPGDEMTRVVELRRSKKPGRKR